MPTPTVQEWFSDYLSPEKKESKETQKKDPEKMNIFEKATSFTWDYLSWMWWDFQKEDYGKWIMKLGLWALALLAFKEVASSVLDIWKWMKEKFTWVKGSTETSILKTLLGWALWVGAASIVIDAMKWELPFWDMITAFQKDGIAWVGKLIADNVSNVPAAVTAALTPSDETKAGIAASTSIWAESEKSIREYLDDPSFKWAWDAGKAEIKDLLRKMWIEDPSFIDSLDGKIEEVLKWAGFTVEDFKKVYAWTPVENIPTFVFTWARIAWTWYLTFIIWRYLLSPKVLKGLWIGAIALTATFAAIYLWLKVMWVKVPIADEHIPENLKESLKMFEWNEKLLEPIREFLANKEAMKRMWEFINYLKTKAWQLWIDLSWVSWVWELMPTLQDIRNLNPILLFWQLLQDWIDSYQLIEMSKSAWKIALAGFIIKNTRHKILKWVWFFALYCLYDEWKKLKWKDPENMLEKTELELFRWLEATIKYGNNFYKSLIDGLSKNEKTKHLVDQIKNLSVPNEKSWHWYAVLGPEWFAKVMEICSNGWLIVLVSEAGLAIAGEGVEIHIDTTWKVAKAGLKMLIWGIWRAAFNTWNSYLEEWMIEYAWAAIPFLIAWRIGGVSVFNTFNKPKEYAIRTAKAAWFILTIIAILTKWKNLSELVLWWWKGWAQWVFNRSLTWSWEYVKSIGVWISDAARGTWTAVSLTRSGRVASALKHGWRALWAAWGAVQIVTWGSEVIEWYYNDNEEQWDLQLQHWAIETWVWVATVWVAVAGWTAAFAAWLGLIAMAPYKYMIDKWYESAIEWTKTSDEWSQKSVAELMHDLVSTTDQLSTSDYFRGLKNFWSSEKIEQMQKEKIETREKIYEALILKEWNIRYISEEGLKNRMLYIKKKTYNYSYLDRQYIIWIIDESRLYNEALRYAKSEQLKGATEVKFLLNNWSEIDVLKNIANQDWVTMAWIVDWYKNFKNDLCKKEIPEKIFNRFEGLSDITLVTLMNKFAPYVSNKDPWYEKFQTFTEQVGLYLRYKNIFFTPETLFTNEKQLQWYLDNFVWKGSILQVEAYINEIDNDPIAFAMFELAKMFNYTWTWKLEDLKNFFSEDKKAFQGVYWDWSEWVVNEAWEESDDEIWDDWEETIVDIIKRLKENKDDVLEARTDIIVDLWIEKMADFILSDTVEIMANKLELWLKNYKQFNK